MNAVSGMTRMPGKTGMTRMTRMPQISSQVYERTLSCIWLVSINIITFCCNWHSRLSTFHPGSGQFMLESKTRTGRRCPKEIAIFFLFSVPVDPILSCMAVL